MSEPRQIVYIDPNELIPDTNVRRQEGDLKGLAATIREFGVLEPLGVRQTNQGYRLVYGNRRRAAAILAGLTAVPCLILEERAEDDYVIHQLVENLQRRALGDMEQAEGLATIRRRLAHRDPRLTESELDDRVGRLVGLSARTVQRYLALRELPAEVRDLLQDEEISVSQAQHLRQIPQPARQIELARLIVQYDLSAAAARDAAVAMLRRRTLTALEAISIGGRMQPLPDVESEEASPTAIPLAPARQESPNPASDEPPRPRVVRGLGTFDVEVERLLRSVQQGALDRAILRHPKRLRATLDQLRALLRELESKTRHPSKPIRGAA